MNAKLETSDTEPLKAIRSAFETEHRINVHRHPIRLRQDGGKLRLEGEVGSIAAKKLACRIAHRLGNGATVVDDLRVIPAQARGDGEIGDAYGRSLAANEELKHGTIREQRRGPVMLLDDASRRHALGPPALPVIWTGVSETRRDEDVGFGNLQSLISRSM